MADIKTFYIETLGCKVNQYESDGIAADLTAQGLIRQTHKTCADICIINTCAVTSKAGMQSRQAVRRLIRDNPDAKIIVTGCHAQTAPDEIHSIQGVDHLVCHLDKTKIAACVNANAPYQFFFQPPDHTPSNRFLTFDRPVSGSMTRAYLKIQDGCNAFCTYCIVPHARGASVSMPKAQVHRHMAGLADQGFSEVILTGIHTGLYGQDLDPVTTLLDLVQELDHARPVERVRISSIEPREITPGLIDLARQGHILCDHFHIPLQSGDTDILKKMKRPYTADFFKKTVEAIHTALPHAGIGLDTLIGFPGETDRQFEATYNLVKSLPVSYLHVFPFSPRKGTPAWHFNPKVPTKVIKERCAVMRQLNQEKQAAFKTANSGRRLQGLVQHTRDKATGLLKAVTRNYLTLLVDGDDSLKGKILDLGYDRWDKDTQLITSSLNYPHTATGK